MNLDNIDIDLASIRTVFEHESWRFYVPKFRIQGIKRSVTIRNNLTGHYMTFHVHPEMDFFYLNPKHPTLSSRRVKCHGYPVDSNYEKWNENFYCLIME